MAGGDATMEAPLWRAWLRSAAYSAGVWVDAADRIEVTNPADGRVLGTVPRLGAAEMRQAIGAARAALPGWRALLPRERGDLLMAWRALMLENRDSLAMLMTMEQGKPLGDARGEIEYGAEFLRWFAEEASRLYGEVIPSHLPGRRMYVSREPIGVVGLITPWNFPSAMLTRKAAAALGAGCAVVATPSNETPFSALALAALAERAGIPAGVFSVLTGAPEELVGEICRNPTVRGVSFTGSTQVGRLVASLCAPTVKRVSLELGGHAPVLVFADADLEAAASAAVAAKFQTSGQDCLAANRIFVERSAYADFTEAFLRATKRLKVGAGVEPDTSIGPLMNAAAVTKTRAHVEDAIAKGARLLCGGQASPRGPLFYPPTVLADVTSGMTIMHEETFGPVAALLPFDGEAEVVVAANDTEYGLVAYLFTRDLSRAHRVADALEYGMVSVNTAKLTGAPIPFGGVKQSGLGREGSRHGVDEFTELKYLCLALEAN